MITQLHNIARNFDCRA